METGNTLHPAGVAIPKRLRRTAKEDLHPRRNVQSELTARILFSVNEILDPFSTQPFSHSYQEPSVTLLHPTLTTPPPMPPSVHSRANPLQFSFVKPRIHRTCACNIPHCLSRVSPDIGILLSSTRTSQNRPFLYFQGRHNQSHDFKQHRLRTFRRTLTQQDYCQGVHQKGSRSRLDCFLLAFQAVSFWIPERIKLVNHRGPSCWREHSAGSSCPIGQGANMKIHLFFVSPTFVSLTNLQPTFGVRDPSMMSMTE